MRTIKEIQAEIREVKKTMKTHGIVKRSCFNGGHDTVSYSFNCQLFALSVELDRARKQTA